MNRPDLTAEKFIHNPFVEGKTMYCTGDLARWRADGEIEYLGRIDTQVKIRGLRIELGEIESVMSSFEGIHLTAVTDKRDENNRQYLVGYYTADTEIDEKALRQYLSEKLPKYMVPNFFIHLDNMPMTASGKTDRKNLPLPDFSNNTEEYVAPVTDTEKALAEIWTDILHFDGIGRNSDFIECGGDSLAAITMLAEIEEKIGIYAELKMIMEHTVLSDLAECIDNSERKSESIPTLHAKEYILTPQQKAIYLACQKDKSSLIYNMPMFISLADNADIAALKEKIRESYKKHSVLRTAIAVRNDEIIGVIDDEAELIFEQFNSRKDFVRPFDLSKAPLIHVGFGEGGIAIDIHHIAGDGESLNIILDKIFNGTEISETVSYADYAEYINHKLESGEFSEHKNYFKNALHVDMEPLELPKATNSGNTETNYTYILNNESVNAVKDFAKTYDLTETCAYLALYGILMSEFANKQQVVTSIILSNRMHSETRYTCGMFVNTIPLVLDINPELTLGNYAEQLNNSLLDIYKYQELPFLEICEAAGIKDKNVINSTFVYQPGEMKINGLDPEYIDTYTHKMDFSFQVIPQSDGSCKVMLEYNNSKYDKFLMERLAVGYEQLISQIKANKKLKELEVMGKAEYQQVVYSFNNTSVDYPRDKCVHELFTEQAAKTPDKIALVFEDKQFTYKLLDEMSNSLAHYLREKGIKPNDIVPIITKRSWHIVVAMIAVFKAGGAYMPIDPNYPIERIQYMIDEADSKLALTYGYEKSINIRTVSLEVFDFGSNISTIEKINTPEDTCYVIFTSGSTGKPKGVLLKHSGLVNFANSNNVFHKTVFENCSNVLAIGAFTFDISVVEIFQPLLNGDCIVIADDDTANSSECMAEVMIKNEIDLLHTTPTRLSYYLDNEKFREAAANLKVILSAGEAFSTELFNKIRNCTDAKIYNGYGPTETTVGCSFVEVTKPNEITIGKPISNVQIYILNRNGKPCPIGVAGELCIAGAGVGKGYLKRPELTAERFVSNPFIEGGRMYKSGDLARWKADGEIEYLGRIDTQVKIRGLRIELGEIESVMCSFNGIKMSAATDKRDSNGRQYLVGYYTSDEYVDEKLLREFLSSKLPKYMVPNYFMRLDEIPMTVSGKTDRKALPVPSLTASISEYVEPSNDIEKTLCEIAAELLNYEKVSINDDFFELGGDSLKAIEYTAEASDKGIVFDLQAVFEHPTIAELSKHISENTMNSPEYFKSDFDKFSDILAENKNANDFAPQYTSLGNILITGVTGYLGAHILDSLMRHETGKIYCLVRSNSPHDRRGRWPQMLNYYFGEKYKGEIGKRIIPIVGDIIDENLSETLSVDIQTVIHAAATVKHFGEYDYFYSVNVKGTENVLAYAKKKKAKFMFVSTVSVSGSNLTVKGTGTEIFRESDLFIGQNLSNVYIRSKFEAERLVLGAKLEGFDCKIFRVGNLTNRYSDGVFQQNYKENAFLRRMKPFIDLKAYPFEIADSSVEFSPVDYTAEAIVKLAEYTGEKYTVFHVNDPKQISYGHLMEMLRCSEYTVDPVNSEDFVRLLSSEKDTAYDSVKNDLNEMKAMSEFVKVQSDSSFTETLLSKIGFEWCEISQQYIDMYVKHFNNLNYWNTNGGKS